MNQKEVGDVFGHGRGDGGNDGVAGANEQGFEIENLELLTSLGQIEKVGVKVIKQDGEANNVAQLGQAGGIDQTEDVPVIGNDAQKTKDRQREKNADNGK